MSFEHDSSHRDVRPIFDFEAYAHSAVGGLLAMNLAPAAADGPTQQAPFELCLQCAPALPDLRAHPIAVSVPFRREFSRSVLARADAILRIRLSRGRAVLRDGRRVARAPCCIDCQATAELLRGLRFYLNFAEPSEPSKRIYIPLNSLQVEFCARARRNLRLHRTPEQYAADPTNDNFINEGSRSFEKRRQSHHDSPNQLRFRKPPAIRPRQTTLRQRPLQ